MSTHVEDLRYLWRIDLADDATGPLLKATREQERALAVQDKALKKVGDTSGRVSAQQKAAAKTVADAAGLRAREAQRAADREVRALSTTGRSYQQVGREAQQAARQQEAASRRSQAAIREEQRAARSARDDLRRAGGRVISPVRTGATALTAAAGFGIGSLVANYVSFEKQMSRVRAVTQANDEEFAHLQKTALDLGQKTAFNNREVAAAMTELATAGFSVDQVIKTLPGTLNLASATGYDLAQSAELQASALRGFGLEGKDATRVADVLTNTANQSAVAMDDLSESLKYIAPVAKASGQSFESMLSAVGLLGNVGIKGSQAGTTIRTALVRLQAPTDKVETALHKLQIGASDLYGPNGLKPLPEIIGKIVVGAQGMDKSTRNAALAHIFGREALSGMVALVESGEGKYRKFQKALEHSDGAAKRSAATMRDNVAGAWDQFTGSVESAAAALLTKYSPAVKTALDDAGNFVDGLAGAEPKRTIRRDAQGRVTGVQVHELDDATKAGKEFAKTLGQINDGAQDIIGPLGDVAGAAADIGKAHPWIVKTVGSLIALRIAWKAIKITSAGTGLTGFLKTLNRVGGADGVTLGGRIIDGIRGRIGSGGGVIRSVLRKVLGSAGTSAGTVAADRAAAATLAGVEGHAGAKGGFAQAGRLAGRAFGTAVGPAMTAAAVGAGLVLGRQIYQELKGYLDDHLPKPLRVLSDAGEFIGKNGPPGIRDIAKYFSKRHGGVIGAFGDGGMVPAFVSSGEEVHHAGQVWTVPGAPTAADNVLAMLPVGAGVVTFDGQRRMAAGASLGEAIATQAPHFQAGGVIRGKVSTFGPPLEKDGPTAYGFRAKDAGIAVNPDATATSWNNARARSFARKTLRVTIDGHTADLKVIDKGPRIPGRAIDVTGAGARKLGINPAHFPTGHTGTATVTEVGAAGRRILAANRRRQGILPDALEQGISAGQDGRRTAGLLSAVQQAGQITPPKSKSSSSSRTSYKDGAVTYDGKQIAGWIKPHLDYMRSHGWRGRVNEGVRSYAEQKRLWDGAPANGLVRGVTVAKPGESKHRGVRWPLGAVDLTDWQSAKAANHSQAKPGPLKWYGPVDPVHFSATGHRRGGIIGRFRSGGTLRGAVNAATSFDKGALPNLDSALTDVAESRLLTLKARMLREARKGGDEKVVKRYQQIVSLIDGQLGVRIGRLQAGIERRSTRTTFATELVQRRLRRRGVAADSTQGLQTTERAAEQFEIPGAKANLRDAQAAFRKAKRAGANPAQLRELQQGVNDAMSALDEALVTQTERRRQIIQRQAQDKVDDAQNRVDWNNAGQAFLDASQRVQGTAGTSAGLLQKAGAIQSGLPALQALKSSYELQGQAALQTGDFAGFRAAMLAAQGAATDLANAQADAGELIKQAADAQVDAISTAAEYTKARTDTGFEQLQLQQQLAGTDNTPAAALERQNYIRGTIITAIQKQIAAQEKVVKERADQYGADSEQARAEQLKLDQERNDLLRANLDANQQTASNTEPLKELTGTSSFDFHGERFQAGLLNLVA